MKINRTDTKQLILSWGLTVCFLVCLTPALRATEYYINSRSGSDRNAGVTKRRPWKTLKNLSLQSFTAGDRILFSRGSQFTGGFTFRSSGTAERPIVFSSYGRGPKPSFSNPDWNVLHGNIFKIEGSYIVINDLYFHDNTLPPGSNKYNKNVQKMGVVYFDVGANHNRITHCEFYHSPVGIKVKGNYTKVTYNYLHDADSMARTWGAIAIMVVSAHNEIAYNRITRYGYYGGAYGSDGGAIELDGVDSAFDGRDVQIHHNISIGNHGFIEIAGRHVEDITIAYNLSDDVDKFLGVGNMRDVLVINNTIIRTREPNVDRFIFWTFDQDNTHCVVRNNIFVLPRDIQVFGPVGKPVGHHRTGFGEQPHDHNLYFVPAGASSDPIGIPPGEGDLIADPRFKNPNKEDFNLTRNSPAINKGATNAYKKDLDGRPLQSQPDLGAYEFD